MKYRVKLTATAAEMFNHLHPDIRKKVKSILKELYQTPRLGKPLQNELSTFRSLTMKRYRAIYQVDDQSKVIIVFAIGHRRDIYETIAELVR